jgi:hypothetical protein
MNEQELRELHALSEKLFKTLEITLHQQKENKKLVQKIKNRRRK